MDVTELASFNSSSIIPHSSFLFLSLCTTLKG